MIMLPYQDLSESKIEHMPPHLFEHFYEDCTKNQEGLLIYSLKVYKIEVWRK